MNGAASGAAAGSTFGPWGTAIGAGIGLLGGFGSSGGNEAQAAALAQQQAQLAWNKQQDPFSAGGNREQYVPQLNALMAGGPSGVVNDPMFQKQNQQSMMDMQRHLASTGQGASGNEMLSLNDQSFNNQNTFFNQQYDRLASLSGASRGGGSAALGMSPQLAGNFARQSTLDTAGGFGQLLSGLSGIFGTPQGTQVTPQNMNGFQTGNTQSAINGAF